MARDVACAVVTVVAGMIDTSSATLRIRLLGPVELAAQDVHLTGTKQPLILTVLALRPGEAVPTDTLIEILWPLERPADPHRSLQVHVSNLRRALEDADTDASIDHRTRGYVLHVDPQVVDVHRFEHLVEEGLALVDHDPDQAREILEGALSLWRGPPLGQLGDRSSLQPDVTRLEDLRLRALEARIEADLATGRHEEVTDELRHLARQHPLRESLWGQLMMALYGSGRQAEALAAYETARQTLSEKLGTDPSQELREIHTQILQQELQIDGPRDLRRTAPADTRLEEARSIAILPFEVFGDAERALTLALGLHNDLLTELSKFPELTVISRTSVLGYRGTQKPIPRIARELNVGTVVEGTVQSAGRRLRLTVQVIDGQRDAHRWAESYDCELTTENLFAIQSDLAREIATSLSAELVATSAGDRDERPATDSLDAYHLAAKARQCYDLRTEEGFQRAIELYEDAVDLDPRYTDAWVGLADALTMMDGYGHGDRHELLPRAEQAVHRALALNPESAGAHTSLAILHCMHQDGPASLREFEHAIQLQPSYADAHDMYTWVLLLVGRAGQALDAAERTVELDPLSAEPRAHLALVHAALNEKERGLEAARQARRFSPYRTADFYEGICLYELGRYEQAREVLEPLHLAAHGELAVPWAGHGPDATLALSLAALGESTAARAILEDIDHVGHPFAAGLVQLGLEEFDAAAEAFRRVEHVSAWPSLAIHHYYGQVWRSGAAVGWHEDLVRTAYRSWKLDFRDN